MKLFDFFKRRANPSTNINTLFSTSYDAHLGQDATSFAAIDLIASAMANLQGEFFNRTTKQALKEHSLRELIDNPNYDETKFTFFYNSVKDYFSGGNTYWYKYDNDQGEIIALFRLNPNDVKVRRNFYNQKVFIYKGIEYTSEKILHIRLQRLDWEVNLLGLRTDFREHH